jgi:hypothetical protein
VGGGGGVYALFFGFGPWVRDRKRETLHLSTSRKEEGVCIVNEDSLLDKSRAFTEISSHTRLGQVRDNLSRA